MLVEKQFCVGCGSCSMICPKHCITMDEDKEGFLYPNIDHKKCISCGVCEKACPLLVKSFKSTYNTKSYAAQNRNDKIRKNSSSGGVFYSLALTIIKQGGVICAAKYSENFEVIHSIATTKDEIWDCCGSKYAQSRMGSCFIKIKRFLCQGRKVLFVGTPCQVAGLQTFLKHSYDNLFLVDVICHGVPSPAVWKNYLEERKQVDADGSEIIGVNLRDKSTGWSNYSYSVRYEYQNGKVHSGQQDSDRFMQGFISNLYLRPSCSNCKFKGIERGSDITMGDYWGVWHHYPEFDDDKGTSLVMIHSEKGLKLWESVIDEFNVLEINNEQAVQYNPSALESSYAASRRNDFFRHLQRNQGESVSTLIQFYLQKKDKRIKPIVHRILSKIFSCPARGNSDGR